jgi:hypothetical protein
MTKFGRFFIFLDEKVIGEQIAKPAHEAGYLIH